MRMGKAVRTAIATTVAAAAMGTVAVAPASADSVGGWPCGLSVYDGGHSYTIANCNTFAVSRRVVKSDNSRGSCRHIDGRSWVLGTSSLIIVAYEGC